MRGWHWQIGRRAFVPIDHRILHLETKRLVLKHGKATLNVHEHIGVLKFLGLDDVIISCTGSWPPYHGRPYELWEQLFPFTEEEGVVEWKGCDSFGTGEHDGRKTYFTQTSSWKDGLMIDLSVKYPGIGGYGLRWNTDEQDKLVRYLKAPAPVYPGWYRYPAEILKGVGIWKHHHRVSWPHKEHPDDWVANAGKHRLCDLLGALSLTYHDALPYGYVESRRAGHATDFEAIMQWAKGKTA